MFDNMYINVLFQWPEAVDMYREAMRSWTEHENTFRTDALQVSQAHKHIADFEYQRLTIENL